MELRPLLDAGTSPDASFRSLVDAQLETFLGDRRQAIAALAPEAVVLVEEVARMLQAGGKRLRPMFCLWGHRAGGGDLGPEIVRAGGAVELLHTSALIHDDVIDRSPLRRGEPTAFSLWSRAGPGDGERGRAAAILSGDLAHALADEMLAGCGFPPVRVVEAFGPFNAMKIQAVSGELLDVQGTARPMGTDLGPNGPSGPGPVSEERVRRTAALKTGSYTVLGPLLVGAALTGATAAVVEALRAYGGPLGEAFQLRDDVLGTFGDPASTGKDRDADVHQGKQTILVAKAMRLASPDDRRTLTSRLGREDLTEAEVEEVRTVFRTSGALAETLALIASLASQATSGLPAAPIPEEAVRALGALADLVTVRDA